MILKVKSGILINVPHLKGKTEEEANNFFERLEGTQGYNMRQINDDWYLDLLATNKNDFDDSHNTAVTGYSLKSLKECADLVIEAFEALEPEYYEKLENWCNPHAYFFIGDWKDIKNAYIGLQKLI